MAAAVEDSSSAPAFNSEEVVKLMGKGKRHYVCSEITQAVKCFEEVCEALGKHYGEMANECGDAYLYYGKALLDLARMESNAIGTALQGAPEEEDASDVDIEEALNTERPKIKEMTEEQKEEVLKKVIDAMTTDRANTERKEKQTEGEGKATVDEDKDKPAEENKENVEKPQESSKEETKEEASNTEKKTIEQSAEEVDSTKKEGDKDNKKGEEDNKEGDEDNKGDEDSSGDKDNKGGNDEEGEDEEMEEEEGENASEEAEEKETMTEEQTEVSNIQLAWEILELARVIFERQEGRDANLHSAQCHLKLGEIKMEQEQFEDAIADLVKCLELQKKHLESDDRLLAETLYNIGLCHSFQSKFDKAKDAFSEALNVIKLRRDNLEKRVADADSKSKGKGKANATDPAVIDRKELKELEELYPEIKAKVDDANEMLISGGSSVKAELAGETTNGFGTSSSNDQPATLITVKKAPKEAVSDISHLVKKVSKRKPEEENKDNCENEAVPSKKPRQETNGEKVSSDDAEKATVNGTDKSACADNSAATVES